MRSGLALITAAAMGCYNPSPPAGVACTDDDHCPSSQKCIAGYCGGLPPVIDAPAGAVDVAPDVPLCMTWSAKHFDPCAIPAPPGDLDLNTALAGYSWDTDAAVLKGKMNTTIPVTTMVLTQNGGPDVLLASVKNFSLAQGADLTVTGSRPLLIAVWGTATVAGNINVNAVLATSGPGGSNGTICTGSTGVAGANGAPAGGGGGGAFQGKGGAGANTGGGAGGMNVSVPSVVRGGCAGGSGGIGTTTLGTRGAGGGAIQITALDSITIDGVINAAGGGGTGGRASTGAGGGGGSGGFIGLDSKLVTIAGTLAANGGAGGGGASDVANGTNGGDGRTTTTVAPGGPGAATSNIGACGRGGNGAAGGMLDAENGVGSACGGGGGGGAAGFVVLWSAAPTVTGTVTPPASGGP